MRAGERLGLNSEWSKAKIESLVHSSPGSKLEAMLVTLFPEGASGKRPVARPYEEFAMVLSGCVSLKLGDQPEQVLNLGDAVSIRLGLARQWQNNGGGVHADPGCDRPFPVSHRDSSIRTATRPCQWIGGGSRRSDRGSFIDALSMPSKNPISKNRRSQRQAAPAWRDKNTSARRRHRSPPATATL